ncbi:MAG: hypothetical protein LBI66_06785 [Burkholderiaceae bacterium]|jgi:hemerythrin|nr:hypothetical protein [Burkholderiaceae bacterium]
MSVRDPVLDAQHIELLELCRTVQELVRHGRHHSDLCVQRLEQISRALREHDLLEASQLQARGQGLPDDLRAHRALARQQLEKLASAVSVHEVPQARFQAMLCGWIRHHLH